MKARKPIIVFLVLITILVLGGCSSKETGPKKLWNQYVDGMNNKDIEKVAATFYSKGSGDYTQYVSNEKNLVQFDEIEKITTKKFELDIQSDLSSSTVVRKYYSAKVSAVVISEGESFSLEFDVYMSQTTSDGWFFTSEVSVDPFADKQGNLPNDLWLRSALRQDGQFIYKPSYVLADDEVTYSEATIYLYEGNEKNVDIPSEINGLPVTTIEKYAFMKLGSIFEVTYSSSKMRTVTIPETVTTIKDYAFFQCSKLKELTIPSKVENIGQYAFSSCKNLKKIVFNIDDSNIYTEEFLKEKESSSTTGIVIKNARNMYVGDIVTLVEEGENLVTWSVDKTDVASIDADKGIITALKSGDVTITASLKSDPTIKATVKITVSSCDKLITVQGSAFDRCSGLRELYIYAKNPNSLDISGTELKLSEKTIIYVPKGSKEMYANSSYWSSYKEQIKEME